LARKGNLKVRQRVLTKKENFINRQSPAASGLLDRPVGLPVRLKSPRCLPGSYAIMPLALAPRAEAWRGWLCG